MKDVSDDPELQRLLQAEQGLILFLGMQDSGLARAMISLGNHCESELGRKVLGLFGRYEASLDADPYQDAVFDHEYHNAKRGLFFHEMLENASRAYNVYIVEQVIDFLTMKQVIGLSRSRLVIAGVWGDDPRGIPERFPGMYFNKMVQLS
jgi:hypothetical protein